MEKIIGKLESHPFYEKIEVSQFLPELRLTSTICLKSSKTKACPSKISHSTANSMDLLLRDMSTFCGKKTVAQTIQLNKRPLIMQENFCLSAAPMLKKEGTAD